ncbi:nucleoside triphosphate hydrolase [Amylibacter ulvae]|uniref:Nucleoside triphosphate hydrolase n=1 Tax=Paramylibacter ulvae TaxID=1651968 RepID=A0ABQ3CW15_9RHOB|nr:AAA family ATPase [Amylibacter ulvae]GHA43867.1 nucleoside triphosphate hydrolase [Amylibacter ulvae]
MISPDKIAEALLDPILAAPRKSLRKLIAIAGPPASGKSTIAAALSRSLNDGGHKAQVVPMDGFHLDNTALKQLNLLDRKGAPETFDATRFLNLVKELSIEKRVTYPIFDRGQDKTIVQGGTIEPHCDIAVLEGNYLLLDAPVWRELMDFLDFSIFVEIPTDILNQRLIERWIAHGYTLSEAKVRAEANDLINARQILEMSNKSDLTIQPDGDSIFVSR